jgi:hypothetical protein
MALWVVTIAVFILGVASTCQADCREGIADRLIDQIHEGVEGFFLTTADAECFARQAQIMGDLEAQVAELTARAGIADARYVAMLEATARGAEVIATQEEALAASIRRAITAERREESILRSPLLWFTIGVAVTAIVGVVVSVLVDAP